MYTPTSSDALLKAVSLIITKRVNANALYCFGRHSTTIHNSSAVVREAAVHKDVIHYYLLLFTNANTLNLGADLSQLIAFKTNGACSVTLLIHKPKSVAPRNSNLYHFFRQVLTVGDLVYQCEKQPVYLEDMSSARNYVASERYWQQCYFRAKALLDVATHVAVNDADLLKATLFNQATSLLCLGLIEVFLGYRPNYFSLDFLFGLCRHFTRVADDVFPRSTAEEISLFQLLNSSPACLRHRSNLGKKADLLPLLESRCFQFLQETNILAEVYLMPYLSNQKIS
jgi:hypothetical protein